MCAKFTENPSSLPADPAAFHLAVLGLSGTADLVLEINEQGQRKKKRSGLMTTHKSFTRKTSSSIQGMAPVLGIPALVGRSRSFSLIPFAHTRIPRCTVHASHV